VSSAQHAERRSRLRRALPWLAGGLAITVAIAGVGGYLVYRHLSSNIAHAAVDVPGTRPNRAPGNAQNILLLGSDTRDFKGGAKFGSEITGARSDTTILVHISADGQHAVLVSIPRDTYTRIPACRLPGGKLSTPTMNRFNTAFSIGGPSCTIATTEHLTHLRIDHFVEVNFAGFQHMVDALGGVTVCLSQRIDDPVRINPATGHKVGSNFVGGPGDVTMNGQTALAFVRARYAVGDGSDLSRIKNQQVFMSAVIRKATSTGLLFHPWQLYHFLDAATKSILTDPGFGLTQLKKLAGDLHGLKPGKVDLLTVPLSNPNAYVDIGGVPASVVFWDKQRAAEIWNALRSDSPLPAFTHKHHHKVQPTPSPSLDVVTAKSARCTA
jgi:LCP family protein required for cell wall assembly